MSAKPKYKPEFCQMLIDHMKAGLSFRSFAAIAGVARANLYQWEKNKPAFKEAKAQGIELSLLFWERMGIAGTIGLPDTVIDGKRVKLKSFQTISWIYNMKCRFGGEWREDAPSPDRDTKITVSYEPKTQRKKRGKS